MGHIRVSRGQGAGIDRYRRAVFLRAVQRGRVFVCEWRAMHFYVMFGNVFVSQ